MKSLALGIVMTYLMASAAAADYGPRPAKWCGWYARQHFAWHDPGPQFNKAREWAKYGTRASGPAPGVIVVFRHHVGKITGHDGQNWIVLSGNDAKAVRERPRSLKGVIAYRW